MPGNCTTVGVYGSMVYVGKRLFNIIHLGHTGKDKAIQAAARSRREEQFRGLTEEVSKAAERRGIDSTPYHNLLGNLDNAGDATWDATYSLVKRFETVLTNEYETAEESLPRQPGKGKPKTRGKWSSEEREQHEKKARKFLSYNPKATRRRVAEHLGIGHGSVSGLDAWKNRQPKEKTPAPRGPGKNLTRVGEDIADAENGWQHHRHIGRPEREKVDEQLDEDIATKKLISELEADQKVDAKRDGIPIS